MSKAVYRLSSIARPLEARYPTNRAVLIALPLIGLALGAYAYVSAGGGALNAVITGLEGMLVSFLVWALGREVDGLDLGKALELALIHDLAEVRFGDLPRTAAHYLPDGAKAAAERAAMADLLAPLPGTDQLLTEYQDLQSLEARFVSVCDKLQLRLKAWVYERWGARFLGELTTDGLDPFDDGGFVPVRRLVAALRQRRDRTGT